MSKGYQLKITIKGSKPPIWRRVIVPDQITFRDLDDIIEEVFGWMHSHMFEFAFGRKARFAGSPLPEPEDTADEYIDEWIEEGRTFTYTYDFGDCWEHTIKVEQILNRSERYPVVTKAKGPYMIEDCGGIWGFYEYIEDADPFDIDAENQYLLQMEFPEAAPREKSCNRNLEKYREGTAPEEKDLEEMSIKEYFDHLEQEARARMSPIASLKDVFSQYSKPQLTQIAQIHGFKGYHKFKKNELAEWLKNHLLETLYMNQMLLDCEKTDLDIFDHAIEKKGITIPIVLVEHSLFLCSYTGYQPDYSFLMVPEDVEEKYKKICTREFRQELETRSLLKDYCNGALVLYGAVSREEIRDIYKHYEKQDIPEKLMEDVIRRMCRDEDLYLFQDGLLIDTRMDEHYQDVWEEQKAYPRYLPGEKEEMLACGRAYGQPLGPDTEFFTEYLEKKLKLQEPDITLMYAEISEALRMNANIDEILSIFADYGCKISSRKKAKELSDNLCRLDRVLRRWELNGHTREEIDALSGQDSAKAGNTADTQSKIVPFAQKKKIYPNDPCPCGSGKKYKYCCGKNNPDKK